MTSPVRPQRSPKFRGTHTFAVNFMFAASALGASPQSIEVMRQLDNVTRHSSLPASNRRESRRERFRTLARQWRADTQFLSSSREMAMHPAYQAIIGMGAEVLPFILEDLRDNSGHWFWALKSISADDPVVPRDRGSVKRMRAAWLQWGSSKGLVDA
jgi:hypothetical protein